MTAVRKEPCSTCPYRQDVPSGVWSHDTYEILRPYDADTGEQPIAWFGCHTTPDHYCHGWAVVGGTEGPQGLLALRLFGVDGDIPEAAVPLFSSHNEAADHGQAEIEHPSAEANAAIAKLGRKYERIREGNPEIFDG